MKELNPSDKELTPLERRIKAAALWQIRRIERLGMPESNMPTIRFAFMCDSVIDILDYDNRKKRWHRIEYTVGQGEGHGNLFGFSAYYNRKEIVTKEILL